MKKRLFTLLIGVLGSLMLVSCRHSGRGGFPAAEESSSSATSAPHLSLPSPPALLSGDSLRQAWLAAHYWDHLDWGDPRWLSDTIVLEATFTPWAQLLAQLPEAEAARLGGALFRRGNAYPAMQLRLLDVAEYFWHHPNSPFRNEELFIPVLEAVTEAPDIDTLYKIRPRAQLASARKNRPGMTAADFAYTTGRGAKGTLRGFGAEYALLMFYNPGCPECGRLEEYIPQSAVFTPLFASGRLKVLAIYPDDDIAAWRAHLPQMPAEWTVGHCPMDKGGEGAYDLPGIPALYLLGRDKRVLVKGSSVNVIEAWLMNAAV